MNAREIIKILKKVFINKQDLNNKTQLNGDKKMKNKENYFAIVFKEKATDKEYDVIFPDFDGCVTVGADLDEVRKNANEVLEFHIEGMVEDNENAKLS